MILRRTTGDFYLFGPIVKAIDAIGIIEEKGVRYIPVMANRYKEGEQFTPRPETVSLTNLRKTVEFLSDPETDMQARTFFYEHNPIPGAVWENTPDNPVLMNPDEIMPPDYLKRGGVGTDVHVCSLCFFPESYLRQYLLPERCFKRVDPRKKEGKVSQLVSVPLQKKKIAHNNLMEYSKEYDGMMEVYSTELMSEEEMKEGKAIMVGEVPSDQLIPIHETRTASLQKLTLGPSLRCPVFLPVTTRQIGFGCAFYFRFYSLMREDFPVNDLREKYPGYDIYSLYRISLAAFEAKVMNAKLPSEFQSFNPFFFYFPTFLESAQQVHHLPVPIAQVVNAIGALNSDKGAFLPYIAIPRETDGLFIPRPESVCLTTLRKTVAFLSDPTSDFKTRRFFYEHNPIPGTIWENAPENPVLMNPEEIIPPDYEKERWSKFEHDIYANRLPHQNSISLPDFMHTEAIDIKNNKKGNVNQLVSMCLANIRVPDRKAGECLDDYYRRLETKFIEGDLDDWQTYSTEPLKENKNIIKGIANLLGEVPQDDEIRLPYYASRTRSLQKQVYCCDYMSALLL